MNSNNRSPLATVHGDAFTSLLHWIEANYGGSRLEYFANLRRYTTGELLTNGKRKLVSITSLALASDKQRRSEAKLLNKCNV